MAFLGLGPAIEQQAELLFASHQGSESRSRLGLELEAALHAGRPEHAIDRNGLRDSLQGLPSEGLELEDPAALRRRPSNFITGFESMPVRFTPRPS